MPVMPWQALELSRAKRRARSASEERIAQRVAVLVVEKLRVEGLLQKAAQDLDRLARRSMYLDLSEED